MSSIVLKSRRGDNLTINSNRIIGLYTTTDSSRISIHLNKAANEGRRAKSTVTTSASMQEVVQALKEATPPRDLAGISILFDTVRDGRCRGKATPTDVAQWVNQNHQLFTASTP